MAIEVANNTPKKTLNKPPPCGIKYALADGEYSLFSMIRAFGMHSKAPIAT